MQQHKREFLRASMAKALKPILLVLFVLGPVAPSKAQDAGDVYFRTGAYGVLAGSVTGLASMVFYPAEDKWRNVAVGASVGLYAGLLLGTYLLWGGGKGSKSASNEGTTWTPVLHVAAKDEWAGGFQVRF